MTYPLLPLLTVDIATLLLLGACGAALPYRTVSIPTAATSGVGLLLCLPPLLIDEPLTTMTLPVGIAGLSVHLALDAVAAFFLLIVFLAGSAIAAFQATSVASRAASPQATALGLAGAGLTVLAADGGTLAVGLAVLCAVIWLPQAYQRHYAALLIPLLPVAAIGLMTPAGHDPGFALVRAASTDTGHLIAVAGLIIATVVGLGWSPRAQQAGPGQPLLAGFIIPVSIYLAIRFLLDLPGAPLPSAVGFSLTLLGGSLAAIEGWRAASHPLIDGSAACLARRQAGFAMTGLGLTLVARAADLPGAASVAFAATLMAVLQSGIATVLVSIAVAGIGSSAGTTRLSSLGGLLHIMPITSFALASGLLGLSALPPGVGFAELWLLIQSILTAPRSGGLLLQLPLALSGGMIALSAAAATGASVRLIGVALLGRPRTPLGAAAQESTPFPRMVLLVMSGLTLVVGVLPGPVLWALAGSPLRALTDAAPYQGGLASLAISAASPGYMAIPILAVLILATTAALLAPGWLRQQRKTGGFWADGREPQAGFPFGEPAAQSIGDGFLPKLPQLPLRHLPAIATLAPRRPPAAATGLILLVAACGAMLLVLGLTG